MTALGMGWRWNIAASGVGIADFCSRRLKRVYMQTISINLPDTAFAALRKAPDEFAREKSRRR
jgi:hypothetical protein